MGDQLARLEAIGGSCLWLTVDGLFSVFGCPAGEGGCCLASATSGELDADMVESVAHHIPARCLKVDVSPLRISGPRAILLLSSRRGAGRRGKQSTAAYSVPLQSKLGRDGGGWVAPREPQ